MKAKELNGLERRKVEMGFAVPLIRHLQKELGEQAVNAALESWTRSKTEEAHSTRADLSACMGMQD